MRSIPEKTLNDLEWPQILRALSERAKTDLGKARALSRPFLEGADSVHEELARIEELRALAVTERLSLPFWGVRDVRGLLERAQKGGTLDPGQLTACAAVLQAMARGRDFVEERRERMPRAWAIAERIAELDKLARRIERSFDPSGELSDHASPELHDLRERTRGLHRGIKAKLDQLLHDEQLTRLLRETYFTIRNERYVVPVLASARSQVPGIVHNASQSGQTLFVEPEPLIGLGNELTIAQSMVLEEEHRILAELSSELGKHATEIEISLEAVCELDAVEAAAALSLELDALPPQIVPAGAPFRLLAMRHPLLMLQQKAVVANDLGLSEGEQVLVISGPNAGGKTVTLKALGLCSLMLRAGLPVPAEQGSSLPLWPGIACAVGDDQDLAKDLSTFSAHLTSLRDIARAAGPGTLALVDEIAADTDPREGAAIALAVLEDLARRGARIVVTTHLEELKAVAVTDPHWVNARVGFDSQHMAPTYRLQYGIPGSSSAIEIARRVGLDPAVCARAEETMRTASGPLGQALAALERERAEAESERRSLAEAERALGAQRAELERERQALRAREQAIQAEARRELLAEVDQARAQVAQLLATLQARPSVRAAVETQGGLAKMEQTERQKLEHQETAMESESERLPEGAPFVVGMRVKLPNKMEGQVLELSGDEALVGVGALKVRKKLSELVPLRGQPRAVPFPGKTKQRAEKLRQAEQVSAGEIDFGTNRCDVRGMRAEDALRAVETFLDRSYGEGRPGALIVHGLGTGALRATIRDYVKGSAYVSAFRAGAEHEGGEGVTVVELQG
jgi:DNA mismatch repair protein MutS2